MISECRNDFLNWLYRPGKRGGQVPSPCVTIDHQFCATPKISKKNFAVAKNYQIVDSRQDEPFSWVGDASTDPKTRVGGCIHQPKNQSQWMHPPTREMSSSCRLSTDCRSFHAIILCIACRLFCSLSACLGNPMQIIILSTCL